MWSTPTARGSALPTSPAHRVGHGGVLVSSVGWFAQSLILVLHTRRSTQFQTRFCDTCHTLADRASDGLYWPASASFGASPTSIIVARAQPEYLPCLELGRTKVPKLLSQSSVTPVTHWHVTDTNDMRMPRRFMRGCRASSLNKFKLDRARGRFRGPLEGGAPANSR